MTFRETLQRRLPFLLMIAREIAPAVPFLVLYGAGIVHWVMFFRGADLRVLDWRLTLEYQSVLRDALAHLKMPYLMTMSHYTDRFLALPETPLSPQFALLPFTSDWTFNVFNICLLFTICFWGLLLIRREFSLSWLSFFALYLLFNFNGYLVSRTAAGHTMWFGCFFLPFFHLHLLRILRNEGLQQRSVLALSLTLFAMSLQGSFHLYVWCNLYLALVAMFNPRRAKAVGAAMAWSAVLCTYRLLPGALVFWGKSIPLETGYASFGTFLDGLTAQADFTQISLGTHHAWWEFDCFVGMSGLVLLVYFGLYRRAETDLEEVDLRLPNVTMLLMSLGAAYGVLAALPIPLLASQRLASRFVIVPLTMLMVLAAIHIDRRTDARRVQNMRFFVLVASLFLMGDLYTHSVLWRINRLEIHYYKNYLEPLRHPFVAALPAHDPGLWLYIMTTNLSILVSMALLCFVVWRLTRMRREQRAPGTRSAGYIRV